ncbi:non-canonical purine NTP pyrophosphatase [Candidatus Gottesmanbacteria bacterium]|nr:non-canonical purine NTP pyrophosphatase [Candidatus Gottesmanbacteria bacterium]
MKKLLIATTNPGKLAEIKRFLSDLPLQFMSLKDIETKERVKETGNTFEENAILKATFYAEKSGLPTIGDDGGLEIDALGGEPGVKSHRWIHGDREDDDEELIHYAFKRMRGLPRAKREAQLRAVLALALPDGEVHTATAATRGIIPDKPSKVRVKGFPYRSILYIPEIKKYYNHDELTPSETEKYNHRKRALDALKPFLRSLI